MRASAVLLVLASACGFTPGNAGQSGTDGPPGLRDARGDDSTPLTADAPACFQQGLIDVCLTTQPAALTLDGTINTGTDTRCLAGETEGCVIAAHAITISGTVTGVGTRPLILVSETTIDIAGTLDVSSPRGGMAGAGASSALCTTAGAGTNGDGGASGGAGGSFGTKGGDGAIGDTNGARLAGGVAGATQSVTAVRGGCPGAKGGDGTGTGGAGGDGGGAVYLAAKVSIHVSGGIYAAGGGGAGGNVYEAAGGGGGTGGMVGLDAPSIAVDGTIAANGGGGGGGAGTTGSNNGGPGGDGTKQSYTTPAAGGSAGRYDSGTGGTGAAGAVDAQTPTGTNGGGGGGGGGVGVVWVKGTISTAAPKISPSPQLH